MAKIKKELEMGIHNRFDIEVVDARTGEVKQRARAFNVICANYYKFIFYQSGWYVYEQLGIAYGRGAGTPSASDTALFSKIGDASSDAAYSPFDRWDESEGHNGIWSRQIKRTIPNNSAVGEDITEVGLTASRYNGSGTSWELVTHAMLQDMNGNPISIHKTDTDVINIYSTLYLHYAGQDSDLHLYFCSHSGSNNYWYYYSIVEHLLLSKGPYNGTSYFVGSLGAGVEDSWYALSYQSRRQCLLGEGGDNRTTRDATNKTLKTIMAQTPIGYGNIGGVKAIRGVANSSDYGDFTCWILECGKTTIPPFNISGESVGVGDGTAVKFKTKWPHPYNATVYINGVAVTSGVTVRNTANFSIGQQAGLFDYNYYYDSFASNSYKYVNFRHKNKPSLIVPNQYSGQLKPEWPVEVIEDEIGLYRINAANGTIKGSNDGITWYDVTTSTANEQMDQSGAHYKLYKNVGTQSSLGAYMNGFDGYNIIFDTPPASGDIITIDYTTNYIPKDNDHVLDMEITFTVGEWTGE